MYKLAKSINHKFKKNIVNPIKVKGKQKIFCIGRNKTGTTSLKQAFIDLDYVVGIQRKAEKLLPYYVNRDFDKIIRYCKSAQVFQDFPFSFPDTYQYMDKAFPGSKFILTMRDSPEQWYESMLKFQSKMFGRGSTPTKEDLMNADYVWKGWIWTCYSTLYETLEKDLYNKEILIESYLKYNESVKEYFKNRPDDLIVINVAEKSSYSQLMKFLDIDSPFEDFPWKNKTSDIQK